MIAGLLFLPGIVSVDGCGRLVAGRLLLKAINLLHFISKLIIQTMKQFVLLFVVVHAATMVLGYFDWILSAYSVGVFYCQGGLLKHIRKITVMLLVCANFLLKCDGKTAEQLPRRRWRQHLTVLLGTCCANLRLFHHLILIKLSVGRFEYRCYALDDLGKERQCLFICDDFLVLFTH